MLSKKPEEKKIESDPANQTVEEALEKTKAAMNNPQPSPESAEEQKRLADKKAQSGNPQPSPSSTPEQEARRQEALRQEKQRAAAGK